MHGKKRATPLLDYLTTVFRCPVRTQTQTSLHFLSSRMKLPTQYKPTTVEDWTRSDVYHNAFLIPHDEAIEAATRNSTANGLPEIAVTAAQGKFLSLLARGVGARRILEVGTIGGYVVVHRTLLYVMLTDRDRFCTGRFSAIWFAKALPADGKLITLEVSEKHASVRVDASQDIQVS